MSFTLQRPVTSLATGVLGLPAQTVSTKEKQSVEWGKKCLDFFDYESSYQSKEKYDIWKNFKMVNGDFDLKDYKYVTDPLSMGDDKDLKYGKTMNVVHYPIMNRPIQTILGEYINRPFNYYVVNECDNARNEYVRVKTEMLQNWAMQRINKRLAAKVKQQGVDPSSEKGQQMIAQMTPEDIQDYMDKDYIDIAEQVSQRLLKNIWRTESLDDEFMEGFKNAVISAREFYHTYTVNGRVKIKGLSPLEVFYHRSPSVRWISEAQYAGYRRYLTPSSIIDLHYDKLSVKDIEMIEALTNPNKAMAVPKPTVTGIGSISYDTWTYRNAWGDLRQPYNDELRDMIYDYQMNGDKSNTFSTFGLIKVVQAYWKSYRKVGFLKYYDEFDREQETIVDDNYVPNKDKGEHVDFKYINQIYEGSKIGDNIYLECKPYTENILDIQRLDYCPLPIEGCTYNDTNSKPLSLVDLMRPWNELYNIVAYELRKDMNSSLGKVMFMSIDHIPNIPGFSMEKWYYWAKEFKIAWVKAPAKGPNTFNQFSAADLSFAQQMIAKMEALEKIKQECDAIAGFTPSRIGGASNQNTLGESKQQYVASVNQTEYYFFKHNKLIERVLNYALNIGKKLEKNYGVMRAAFNDLEQAYLLNDGDVLSNASLSLYVTNSAQDLASRQKLEQLIQLAVSNGADIVDAGDIVLSQSVSETRNIFNSLRRKKRDADNAAQQHEKDMEKMQQDGEQRILDSKETIAREGFANRLDVAYVQTFGHQKNNMMDNDADGTPDILEWEQMMSDNEFKHRDTMVKERKQMMDEQIASKNLSLQDKKLSTEKYRVDKQVQMAEDKNKTQLQVAKMKPKPKSK